jgi:rare lipoprotein A
MRLPVNRCLALAAPFLLLGCSLGGSDAKSVPIPETEGPGADYPVVVGDPFTIEGVTYKPEDVMNYDVVGYALAGDAPGGMVAAAHKTLPLPSYVEVTHLDTGRTVLVRATSRGPMRNDALIGLTPEAAMQLGIEGQAPVRVRRVNPPEEERALLRLGQPVPPRMDTPTALLSALRRKLGIETGPAPRPVPRPPIASVDPDLAANPAATSDNADARPAPEPAKPVRAARGSYVQIGAFSSEANARKAAAPLSGEVSQVGKLWVARLGPFASKAEADAALAKARAAGYGDAMVRRVN